MAIALGLGRNRWTARVWFAAVVNLVSYLIYRHAERPLQAWKLPSMVQARPAGTEVPRPAATVAVAGLVHAAHPAAGPKAASPSSGGSARNGQSHNGSVEVG